MKAISNIALNNLKESVNVLGSAYTDTDTSHFTINLGKKRYELSNHLGNVLSVISDKPIPHDDGGGNVDYWQADILSAYDYSPFGVMLSGRTFEKEETVQVCHNETTLTTQTSLDETFDTWFTWTTMGSALLTYVNGEMQVSNPSSSSNNIGASKTFVTGSGVHSVSFDIIDNTCATIVLWPPSVTPKTIVVSIRDNLNNVVATGNYTTAGTYNLSFTPTSLGLTYKIEFYMTNASAFCYYRIDDVLITYQSEETTQVCENVSKKGKYPYSFQNQLRDDEIIKGYVNFQYRGYDPRLGRLNWATDPLAMKYPFYSPYAFSGNRVIDAVELEGLEPALTGKEKNGQIDVAEYVQDGSLWKWKYQEIYENSGTWVGIEQIAPPPVIRVQNANTINKQLKNTNNAKIGQTIDLSKDVPFVSQFSLSNPNFACCRASQKILKDFGIPNGGIKSKRYVVAKDNSNSTAMEMTGEAKDGVDYLNNQLESNKPVMVGVNHTTGQGQSDGTATDHYVVIVGRGYDKEKKQVYYNFYEVGTKYEDKGKSDKNRLYLNEDNSIKGTNYSGKRNFTVTEIRKNE